MTIIDFRNPLPASRRAWVLAVAGCLLLGLVVLKLWHAKTGQGTQDQAAFQPLPDEMVDTLANSGHSTPLPPPEDPQESAGDRTVIANAGKSEVPAFQILVRDEQGRSVDGVGVWIFALWEELEKRQDPALSPEEKEAQISKFSKQNRYEGVTDGKGSLVLPLAEGVYFLSVNIKHRTHPELSKYSDTFLISAGDPPRVVVLQNLDRSVSVVVEDSAGKPVRGVSMWVQSHPGGDGRTVSDLSGKGLISFLDARTHVLRFDLQTLPMECYATMDWQQVDLSHDRIAEVRFILQRKSQVRFRWSVEVMPQDEMRIVLRSQSRKQVSIDNPSEAETWLIPGPWEARVYFSASSHLFSAEAQQFLVREQEEQEVQLSFDRYPGECSGVCRMEDGTPLAKMNIYAIRGQGDACFKSAMTDAHGRFHFRGLTPGYWRLNSNVKNYKARHVYFLNTGSSFKILPNGHHPRVECVFGDAVVLLGSLIPGPESALVDKVVLRNPEVGWIDYADIAEGRFTVSNLKPARYKIEFLSESQVRDAQEVDLGAMEIREGSVSCEFTLQ